MDKERVVARLEGKTIFDLRDECYKMSDMIVDMLAEEKNWNKPCDCEFEPNTFKYIDEDAGGIIEICMRCGGDVT